MPADGRWDLTRRLKELKLRKLKTKYIVVFDGSYKQFFYVLKYFEIS